MGKRGIMIMGHGSTLSFNKSIIETHAESLKNKGFENIYVGYNEASLPSISDTMETLAFDGIDEVVCLPFFIASGLHMTRDIPEKLGIPGNVPEATAEINGKNIKIHFETPFGLDPLLTRLLDEKVKDLDDGKKNVGIMIIGHGSKLPYNKEAMEFHADGLRKLGHRNVYIGFNEINTPEIDETLKKMLEDGVDHVIALPLFITLGKHLLEDIPPRLHLKEGSSKGTFVHNGKEISVSYAMP
ncbi:MAG: sirohydrochlorin cobaltochelatase, partial [Candidatus Methanoplasma sp.]|nr:sirohydrochlorin cobaltochelatase [Candidatus Methanoplasma sp.]